MKRKEFIASDNYDSLKKQFRSLCNLVHCLEAELKVYRDKDRALSEKRLLDLEAALASEKEMNAILTKELQDNETE